MSSADLPESTIRFGEFAADLEAGELHRNGAKVKLQGQPFEILALLLKRPGRIVSRDELRQRLWPSDTFVDFEHGLNAAVNRLREALGDSAEEPRFIETVPRRGYRFIGPLDRVPTIPTFKAGASDPESMTTTLDSRASSTRQSKNWQTERPSLRYTVLAGVVLLSAALLGYAFSRGLSPPRVVRYVQLTSDTLGKSAAYAHELPSPLVSDGSRLYFTEGPLGGARLAQVSTAGGDTVLFPAPFRIRRVLDVSPNRHELLVLSSGEHLQPENPLMVLPLPAGSPHRLGDLLAHDASWSPDGEKLAYANGDSLYLAKADGSASRKLTTVPGTAWWPRWSPDGSVLRFTVLEALGSRKLWEVSTDGSHLRPLFSDRDRRDRLAAACCGTWTTDGRYFVFASPGYAGSIAPTRSEMGQLWVIRERATFLKKTQEVTQLTSGPMSIAVPVPSTDGKREFIVGMQRRGQLVRYDRNSRQFVPILSGISADGVDFSKDGQWATYVAFPEGTLWRSKADGSKRLQLTLPPMQVSMPRWSPDGKRIAFVGQVIGKPTKIYLISADGGTPVEAIPGEHNEGDPSWSPDGDSIAFAPWFWLEGTTSIRLLDVRTGRVTSLDNSNGLSSVRWSPNGRQIAALTSDGSQTLVLFDLETRKQVELCESVAYPNWSRDGNYIYFGGPYTSEPALFRVRISDRKVEKLATLDPQILTWAIVGKWTGLAPDDSPLVLRDTSIEEIYALDWETR